MTTSTRVSVCMATYNGAEFVQDQIASILLQLGRDDELIVSDDGSTDDTLTIVAQFRDSRIRLVESRRFGSPVWNFQNALQHATGQFIFLADQDDIWLPQKIDITLSLLADYSLVMTDCRVVDRQGGLIQASFFRIRGSRPGFWPNLWRNSYMGCCMAFRREVLGYALPFPPLIYMHDWWIGLVTELYGTVFFLEQPLLNYTRHGGNASPTGEAGFGIRTKLRNRLVMAWSVLLRITKLA